MTKVVAAEDLIDHVTCFILPSTQFESVGYLKHVFESSAQRCKIENALLCTKDNYYGLVLMGSRALIEPKVKPLESLSPRTKSLIRKRGFSYLTCLYTRILCNGSKYKIKARVILENEVYVISCNLCKTKEVTKLEKLSLKFKL